MNKTEKIEQLNNLISRAEQLTRDSGESYSAVINDTLTFLRNTCEKSMYEQWETQIKNIQWFSRFIVVTSGTKNIDNTWDNGRKKLCEVLRSIKQEIELYSRENNSYNAIDLNNGVKIPVMFLSHSSSDKLFADALRDFIIDLGVKYKQLIYTSHPLHKVPLGENIYEYLRKTMSRNIFMIILWSDEYLESPACLNEMGAAWVAQNDYVNIFVPTFKLSNPKASKCVIDTRNAGVKLNGDENCKAGMIEFKNKIKGLYKLEIDESNFQYALDRFIKSITKFFS